MTVASLRELAKEHDIVGRWDMTKPELVEALTKVLEGTDTDGDKGTTNKAEVAKDEKVVEQNAEGITDTNEQISKTLKPGKRLIETCVNGEKKVIAAVPPEVKRNYIQDVPVGTLIAFKLNDGNDNYEYLVGSLTNRSNKRSVVKLMTENGQEYIIPYEDVVWVKTGRQWPRSILKLFEKGGSKDAGKTSKVESQR